MPQLDDRSVLQISGEDAENFLQNVFTNDIRKITPDVLQYNLLLTPQGQVLQDVFIFRDGVFYIDVETAKKDDLLKRLNIFKLRARVAIEEASFFISAALLPQTEDSCFPDPRYSKLGHRIYSKEKKSDQETYDYNDLCIGLGIPNGTRFIRYGKDFAHEINLDHLHAIAWDKGCFIGQEVAARVYNRGLAKKRLMIITGKNLSLDSDIRQINSKGDKGLAVLRLDNVPECAEVPEYLKI